jgi:hypothetical protein
MAGEHGRPEGSEGGADVAAVAELAAMDVDAELAACGVADLPGLADVVKIAKADALLHQSPASTASDPLPLPPHGKIQVVIPVPELLDIMGPHLYDFLGIDPLTPPSVS